MNEYPLCSPSGEVIGHACGVCNYVSDWNVLEASLEEARACCRCPYCKVPLSAKERKDGCYCHKECAVRYEQEVAAERLANAVLVQRYSGPVAVEDVGHYEDLQYPNMAALLKELKDKPPVTRPKFAYCCRANPVAYFAVDDLFTNSREKKNLHGLADLKKALRTFNRLNKKNVWWAVDRTRKVAIPEE